MDRTNSGQYSCAARKSVRGINVKSSNTVRLHIKYMTVRLSSIEKTISLEVNRNFPSNVVCTIDCNYEGCNSSTIMVLRNSEVYNTIHTNQSIFPSRQALISDDGIYKCKLSDNTESHENLQLAILYGPRNVSIMKVRRNADAAIVLRERDPSTWLTCSTDCNPECKTSWYKDGQLLSHQQHKTLNIRSYRWNSGNYKCEASGIEGTVSSTQVKITVQYSPKNVTIQYTSDTDELWEGNGTITITCNADCNPQCKFLMYRNGRYRQRVSSEKTKVLTMNRRYSGGYSCEAWNSVRRTPVNSSNSITLDIKYGPKIVKIMKGRRNVDAEIVLREGSYGTWLTCSSDCNPTCNISWYRDRHVMSHQRRKTVYFTSNRRNSGNYKCVASGIKETVSSKQVRITVQYKPIVTIPNFPRIAAPGSLKLNFSVDSFPASNVTIFHKEEKLEFFSDFTGNKTYEINISSCLDGGKYRIVAENIIGKQSSSKNLTVQCSPIILTFSNITHKGFEIGDELNLRVKFMANPNPNASWTFFPKEGDVRKGVPQTPTAIGKGFTSIIVSNMSVHDFGTYQLTLSNKFGRNEKEFNIQDMGDSTMYDLSTDQDDVIDQILTSSLSNAKTTNRKSIIRKEEILTLRAEREKYNQETKKLREETGYYRIKTMYLNMRMSQVNKETDRGGGIL
ncbi:hemicentin-1-like [Ostrea edulis]|uniref:hemicentin-1-like n=1 Tax=Ostrea edulis TaxID=37623 RepID=UPI0024AEE149|nr:hemicentin-1-like [Ostrea edulis]